MFKSSDRVVFIGEDWIPQGSKGTVIKSGPYEDSFYVIFDSDSGPAADRDVICSVHNLVNINKTVNMPSFDEWIKGFEDRYTDDQLRHMKWCFEVGVSLTQKAFND